MGWERHQSGPGRWGGRASGDRQSWEGNLAVWLGKASASLGYGGGVHRATPRAGVRKGDSC